MVFDKIGFLLGSVWEGRDRKGSDENWDKFNKGFLHTCKNATLVNYSLFIGGAERKVTHFEQVHLILPLLCLVF